MTEIWTDIRTKIQPPQLRMRHILPEIKKELRLSRRDRSYNDFLDSEWWYDYARRGRTVLTHHYLELHRQWWEDTKQYVEGQVEGTDLMYTIEFEIGDSFNRRKSRVYFKRPPY